MTKHFSIRVTGKVQGVFFRASTKKKASELDVKGIVKNELDGSVYIEAEANKEILNEFVTWCRRGPEFDMVNSCQITEGELKNYKTFEVLH